MYNSNISCTDKLEHINFKKMWFDFQEANFPLRNQIKMYFNSPVSTFGETWDKSILGVESDMLLFLETLRLDTLLLAELGLLLFPSGETLESGANTPVKLGGKYCKTWDNSILGVESDMLLLYSY